MDYLEERKQVLAVAKAIFQSGLVMGTWGNVSARCKSREQIREQDLDQSPKLNLEVNPEQSLELSPELNPQQDQVMMIITPSGMDYETMDIVDLVQVDAQGQVVQGQFKPSTESALHLAIYRARPLVNAIVHTHSLFATAFAVAGKSLPVILEEMAQVIGHEVQVSPYAPCGTEALAETTVAALSPDKEAVFLANHGLVTLGKTPEEALTKANVVEKACQIYIYAKVLGGSNTIPNEDIHTLQEAFKSYGQKK
jgi:L-fuculose-phosphate aldolase